MTDLNDLTSDHLASAGEILACDGSGWAVLLRRDARLAPFVRPDHPGSARRPALHIRVVDLREATCRAAAEQVRAIGQFAPGTMAL
jgi:hypothetical protein